MRFLLDMGISPKVATALRTLGHDAIRCPEAGLSTATDSQVLDYAETNRLVLISTDLDFANLAMTHTEPCPGLILLRLDNPSAELMCSRIETALSSLPEEDIEGSVVVIECNRIRTRKL